MVATKEIVPLTDCYHCVCIAFGNHENRTLALQYYMSVTLVWKYRAHTYMRWENVCVQY